MREGRTFRHDSVKKAIDVLPRAFNLHIHALGGVYHITCQVISGSKLVDERTKAHALHNALDGAFGPFGCLC